MEETYLVLMLKDNKTGFLEKELNAYKIGEAEDFIVNIFAVEKSPNIFNVHMKISVDRDIEDWEFDAIYDYYDDEIFTDLIISIEEVQGSFNPTWEMVFNYIEDDSEMESFIKKLLDIHKNEIYDVYNTIVDKKMDYLQD